MKDNRIIRFVRRWTRVTDKLHGHRFFVRAARRGSGRTVLFATPLFLALVVIEVADIVFAVDSVPAVFAITTDPYLVYTSNIFAILGLRALYFALAAVMHRFAYLKTALAVLLMFVGAKIFVADIFGWAKFPAAWSLDDHLRDPRRRHPLFGLAYARRRRPQPTYRRPRTVATLQPDPERKERETSWFAHWNDSSITRPLAASS